MAYYPHPYPTESTCTQMFVWGGPELTTASDGWEVEDNVLVSSNYTRMALAFFLVFVYFFFERMGASFSGLYWSTILLLKVNCQGMKYLISFSTKITLKQKQEEDQEGVNRIRRSTWHSQSFKLWHFLGFKNNQG